MTRSDPSSASIRKDPFEVMLAEMPLIPLTELMNFDTVFPPTVIATAVPPSKEMVIWSVDAMAENTAVRFSV